MQAAVGDVHNIQYLHNKQSTSGNKTSLIALDYVTVEHVHTLPMRGVSYDDIDNNAYDIFEYDMASILNELAVDRMLEVAKPIDVIVDPELYLADKIPALLTALNAAILDIKNAINKSTDNFIVVSYLGMFICKQLKGFIAVEAGTHGLVGTLFGDINVYMAPNKHINGGFILVGHKNKTMVCDAGMFITPQHIKCDLDLSGIRTSIVFGTYEAQNIADYYRLISLHDY
jgi:hypothetical protein